MNPTPIEIERREELRRLSVATLRVPRDRRVRCVRCKRAFDPGSVHRGPYGVDYCSACRLEAWAAESKERAR